MATNIIWFVTSIFFHVSLVFEIASLAALAAIDFRIYGYKAFISMLPTMVLDVSYMVGAVLPLIGLWFRLALSFNTLLISSTCLMSSSELQSLLPQSQTFWKYHSQQH